MPVVDVTVTGLEEVCRNLDSMPRALVGRGYVRAAEAMAQVFKAELEVNTPVRTEELFNEEAFKTFRHEVGGDLRNALMHVTTLDSQLRGVSMQVGYGKFGWIANLVEYGHRMVTHKPGKKDVGFVKANPFMRRSFDAVADRAIEAAAAELRATVSAGLFNSPAKAA